jgi:dinuclear metal center YbgI/SA1388 family protein
VRWKLEVGSPKWEDRSPKSGAKRIKNIPHICNSQAFLFWRVFLLGKNRDKTLRSEVKAKKTYICLKFFLMRIKELIQEIETWAPTNYAESFDNVGLLVGDKNAEISGVLITHDTLEDVVDEAIAKKMNLIVSFHPIIFSGMKSLTGKNYVERVVMKAIKHDIAIYALHTALDNQYFGVSGILADKLQLQNQKVLMPQANTLKQLVTYVPVADADKVRNALHQAGAGNIGNYSECSFNVEGTGTYKPNEKANPYIGKSGEKHSEKELRVSVIFAKHLQSKVLQNLFQTHPYEEVAYEIFSLDNNNQEIGLGIVGNLPNSVQEKAYLKDLKEKLHLSCIRHSNLRNKPIKKVAVLGGSGSFAINAAKFSGADIYITSDIKYHEFYQGENQMIIADIGHFESEQYTKQFLFEQLTKKIRNFAVALSEINTNPINYL